jgi:hypothetical protein
VARARWIELQELDELVVTVLIVVGLVVSLYFRQEVLASLVGNSVMAQGESLILATVAASLMVNWVRVAKRERSILKQYGEKYIPPVPNSSAGLVVLSTIAFVAFIPSAASPASFGIVYLVIKTLESWNAWVAERGIREGIDKLLADPAEPERGKSQARVIDHYFFANPWRQLGDTGMLITATATILAVGVLAYRDPGLHDAGLAMATLTFPVAIIGHEVIANRWRRRRDRDLKRLADPLGVRNEQPE